MFAETIKNVNTYIGKRHYLKFSNLIGLEGPNFTTPRKFAFFVYFTSVCKNLNKQQETLKPHACHIFRPVCSAFNKKDKELLSETTVLRDERHRRKIRLEGPELQRIRISAPLGFRRYLCHQRRGPGRSFQVHCAGRRFSTSRLALNDVGGRAVMGAA